MALKVNQPPLKQHGCCYLPTVSLPSLVCSGVNCSADMLAKKCSSAHAQGWFSFILQVSAGLNVFSCTSAGDSSIVSFSFSFCVWVPVFKDILMSVVHVCCCEVVLIGTEIQYVCFSCAMVAVCLCTCVDLWACMCKSLLLGVFSCIRRPCICLCAQFSFVRVCVYVRTQRHESSLPIMYIEFLLCSLYLSAPIWQTHINRWSIEETVSWTRWEGWTVRTMRTQDYT